jgi:2-hydroxy-3-keto-5-methylthiopentenyl-1-phosphate phosphatase
LLEKFVPTKDVTITLKEKVLSIKLPNKEQLTQILDTIKNDMQRLIKDIKTVKFN